MLVKFLFLCTRRRLPLSAASEPQPLGDVITIIRHFLVVVMVFLGLTLFVLVFFTAPAWSADWDAVRVLCFSWNKFQLRVALVSCLLSVHRPVLVALFEGLNMY